MKYLTYILTFCLLASCSNNQQTEAVGKKDSTFSKGTFDNGTYTNDYFGFSFNLPENWRVVPLEEYLERNKSVQAQVKEKVDDFDEKEQYFQNMLVIEKDKQKDTLYSYIIFMSEDKSKTKHNAHQYFEYSEKLINQDHPDTYPKYKFGPLKTQKTIGGKDFLAQPVFIYTDEESKSSQMTYCKEFNQHLLVIQLGGVAWKAEIAEAKDLLKSIEWK
jgi:hypothetical protein